MYCGVKDTRGVLVILRLSSTHLGIYDVLFKRRGFSTRRRRAPLLDGHSRLSAFGSVSLFLLRSWSSMRFIIWFMWCRGHQVLFFSPVPLV